MVLLRLKGSEGPDCLATCQPSIADLLCLDFTTASLLDGVYTSVDDSDVYLLVNRSTDSVQYDRYSARLATLLLL